MEKWSLFFLLDQRKYMVRPFFLHLFLKICENTFSIWSQNKWILQIHLPFFIYWFICCSLWCPLFKVWTILKMVQVSQLTTTPRSLLFAGTLTRTSITTVTTLLTVRWLDYWEKKNKISEQTKQDIDKNILYKSFLLPFYDASSSYVWCHQNWIVTFNEHYPLKFLSDWNRDWSLS